MECLGRLRREHREPVWISESGRLPLPADRGRFPSRSVVLYRCKNHGACQTISTI